MFRSQAKVSGLLVLTAAAALAQVSGDKALEYTRQAVAFGPRPAGSAANRKLQAHIAATLKQLGVQVIEDPFIAKTPKGPVAMKNIIGLIPGSSGRALAVSGHFDTKLFPFNFVGANDGGSSTGLLLELARAHAGKPRNRRLYFIWFDGEEAFGEWSATDSLYGSRHLAERWSKDGTLQKLDALINLDMIGDRDLAIQQEMYSSDVLRSLVWRIAAEKGYSQHFLNHGGAIEDDHMPFLKKGVRALDLIDFEYGPNHAWWHTPQDTMDKLSARSLEVVGTVVAEALRRLDP